MKVYTGRVKWLPRVFWSIVTIAVTALVLWWMLDAQVLAELPELVRSARFERLLLGFALVPVVQLLRAVRFRLLLDGKLGWPSYELFRIGILLMFFNYALPFRTGELSFPLLAKRRLGVEVASSAGVLLFSRVLDLLMVVSLGAITAAFVLATGFGPFSRGILYLVAGGSLILLVLLPWFGRFAHAGVVRSLGRFPRFSSIMGKLFVGVDNLREGTQQLSVVLLTLGVWVLQGAISYFAATSVADISVLKTLFAHSMASLAFALPVNGALGVGPTQAAWALALEWAGERFELGVSTALIWHCVPLIGTILLAAVVAIPPKSKPSAAPQAGGKTEDEAARRGASEDVEPPPSEPR